MEWAVQGDHSDLTNLNTSTWFLIMLCQEAWIWLETCISKWKTWERLDFATSTLIRRVNIGSELVHILVLYKVWPIWWYVVLARNCRMKAWKLDFWPGEKLEKSLNFVSQKSGHPAYRYLLQDKRLGNKVSKLRLGWHKASHNFIHLPYPFKYWQPRYFNHSDECFACFLSGKTCDFYCC